ncbi:MAG TPA: hypothetical protein VLU41_05635 [Ideonella sp.]|nr:hypothetical protein [Ideonella sp.]
MSNGRSRIAWRVALVLLALLAVAAATLGTLWVIVAPDALPTIIVNGREIVPGAHAGWLGATLAVLVALVVLIVVVPLALLLATALPLLAVLLGLGLGAAALVLVVALALSPLLLVGWLVWRATRARPDATIPR